MLFIIFGFFRIKEEPMETASIKIEVVDVSEEELDDPWSFLTGQIKVCFLFCLHVHSTTC